MLYNKDLLVIVLEKLLVSKKFVALNTLLLRTFPLFSSIVVVVVKRFSLMFFYTIQMKQYTEVIKELDKLERDLQWVNELKKEHEQVSGDVASFSDADELEAYMHHLSPQLPDKHKRTEWKVSRRFCSH